MKVLLLHPEDSLPREPHSQRWDLVIDCGRAPAATYEAWSKLTACPILSLYHFAKEIEDLHSCRELLRIGFGALIDRHDIDWWDVLSLRLVPDLVKLLAVNRAAAFVNGSCELYATRWFPLATAFQTAMKSSLTVTQTPAGKIRAHAQHYLRALSKLDRQQIFQIIQDKFDRDHKIRSRFSARKFRSNNEFILLPSAYINVSRMAVRYAELLPSEQFLLVFARDNAKLDSPPSNVMTQALDSYFETESKDYLEMFARWNRLKKELVEQDSTFRIADAAGTLDGIGGELRWVLGVRDAWLNLLEEHAIRGCMSADDTNPYTRIPLLLTKNRRIPTLACHHGALDCNMAIKGVAANFYLAKSKMEYDYLARKCRVDAGKIVLGAPAATKPSTSYIDDSRQPPSWMVFFTEPYETSYWRDEELYRDLLPQLYSLAENLGLQLVFKLHPFESVKGHHNKLRRILGRNSRGIQVLSGPILEDLWRNAKFAVTVQSSTALDCARRGVPVFLLAWLRDPYAGYVPQYAKFQVGYRLENAAEIQHIPQILTAHNWRSRETEEPLDAGRLKSLLTKRASNRGEFLTPASYAISTI